MRFLITLLLSSALALTMVAALNYAVDPTGIRVLNDHEVQPWCGTGMRTNRRWTMPLTLDHTPASNIISGTSRIMLGFKEADLVDYFQNPNVINAALPGMTIEEMYWLLSPAIQQGHVTHAILGTEFGMFSGRVHPRDHSITEASLDWRPVRRIFGPYLSFEASQASLRAILGRCSPSRHQPFGFKLASMYREKGKNRPEGYVHISEKNILHRYQREPLDQALYAYRLHIFESLLEESCDNHIPLQLVILPIHQRIHNIYQRLELGGEIQQWKQDITTIAALHKAQGCAIKLWDFSVLNEITQSSLTIKTGFPGGNPWYYEPSHFTPTLGKCLLKVLQGNSTFCTQAPFGQALVTQ